MWPGFREGAYWGDACNAKRRPKREARTPVAA